MELLIVLNVILLLILIGTYLSLSGRVKHLEDTVRRYFKDSRDPDAGISWWGCTGTGNRGAGRDTGERGAGVGDRTAT